MRTKSRYVRKYYRHLASSFAIAIVIWVIVFNLYALHYKLDTFLNDSPHLQPNIQLNKNNRPLSDLISIPPQSSPTTTSINPSKLFQFESKIKPHNFSVNCEAIIEWDENEIKRAKSLFDAKRFASSLNDENYIFDKSMCEHFRSTRGYDSHNIHESEFEFPIAFIILTYYNVQQFERLLRIIYRPHNLYCIHVDANSARETHEAIRSIVQCFDNVFILLTC